MNFIYQLKDGTPFIVRRADQNDLEQLLVVLVEVAKEDDFALLTYPEAKKQIGESKDRLLSLLKNQDEHFIYLIGLVNNQVIAFCDIHIGKNEKTKHVAEFGRSVLKEWRRTGAGKFLQLSAIEYVKSLKTVEKISLNINSNNLSSIESCQSNGFKLEARREKEVRLSDGSYVDLLTYVLYLSIGLKS